MNPAFGQSKATSANNTLLFIGLAITAIFVATYWTHMNNYIHLGIGALAFSFILAQNVSIYSRKLSKSSY